MARTYSIEEIISTPGMYFNPQTEVMIIVDDSADLDSEIFNMEDFEGAEWVLISDDAPVDENQRDEMLERFQVHYHPGGAESITDNGDEPDDELEEDHQEVGRED